LNRNWKTQLLLLGFVIALGLLSRKFSFIFPLGIQKYPGSALWALAVFLAIGLFLRSSSTRQIGVYAIVIAYAVEFSQLLSIPWLNAMRGTSLGHLFLGSTFNPPDFLAYTSGIFLGVVLEKAFGRKSTTTVVKP
jgi:hypothetical protein